MDLNRRLWDIDRLAGNQGNDISSKTRGRVQPPTLEGDPSVDIDGEELWENFEKCKRIPGEGVQTYVERLNEAYEATRAVCAVELRVNMMLKESRVRSMDEGIAMSEDQKSGSLQANEGPDEGDVRR